MGEAGIFSFAQNVVGIRIQGNVHHRLLRPRGLRHPPFEILESPVNIDIAGTVVVDFIGVEDAPFLLVDFLAVIYYRTIQRAA